MHVHPFIPVGVGVVVHEPGAVVVHVHGPGFVVLAQHHVLQHVTPGDAKRRVRVVVVAINGYLPVVHAAGEGRVAHDDTVVITVTCDGQVIVREYDVGVGRRRVKGEPGNCRKDTYTHREKYTRDALPTEH